MDSMRSLNSSLPNSAPRSTRHQSPEQLLQAFKAAALSVTNLYKSAASTQTDSRQQGYQDALEDLLVFLDQENLGLMDGEGWKVRQWATERYSRAPVGPNMSDNEDENPEDDKRARSSSPVLPQNHTIHPKPRTSSPVRRELSAPPSIVTTTSQAPQQGPATPNPPMFTFAAPTPLATSTDADMHTFEQSPNIRTPHKHRSGRDSHRSGNREFRITAGTKRKLPIPDFFNLSNLENFNGKDTFGGASSKKGRFV